MPAGELGGMIEEQPAKPGSIVTVYAAGLGQTEPASVDGQMAPGTKWTASGASAPTAPRNLRIVP